MIILNSRFYHILDVISFFFLLNIIWFLVCMPIVTIFPATAAMFAVIRQFVMKKDTAIFIPFFRYFKENFKHSFLAGIIFFIFIVVFYIDFVLLNTANSTVNNILLVALFMLGMLVTLTSIYLFPVMVHYKLNFWTMIRNSFFFSIKYFPTTIVSIVLLALMFVIVFYFPVTFLMIFSVVAYLIFAICYSKFNKEQKRVVAEE